MAIIPRDKIKLSKQAIEVAEKHFGRSLKLEVIKRQDSQEERPGPAKT